jgi:predicted metal-binding protein
MYMFFMHVKNYESCNFDFYFSFWNKLIIIKCKFSFVVSFEHKLKTVKQNDMIYFASFNILPRHKCTYCWVKVHFMSIEHEIQRPPTTSVA